MGLAMQSQMKENGMQPTQIAFAPTSQSSNQNNGNVGGQGQNNNANQQGQNPNSGNGTDTGNGNGTGSGNRSSSSNGTGTVGLGAGIGQGSRELLTIPQRLNGKTNMEIDNGMLGEGQANAQSDGNGPVLKGSIRPYTEVYRQYEQAYRQSTDRYKYPADLEEIVKSYFTNIDPNKE